LSTMAQPSVIAGVGRKVRVGDRRPPSLTTALRAVGYPGCPKVPTFPATGDAGNVG